MKEEIVVFLLDESLSTYPKKHIFLNLFLPLRIRMETGKSHSFSTLPPIFLDIPLFNQLSTSIPVTDTPNFISELSFIAPHHAANHSVTTQIGIAPIQNWWKQERTHHQRPDHGDGLVGLNLNWGFLNQKHQYRFVLPDYSHDQVVVCVRLATLSIYSSRL